MGGRQPELLSVETNYIVIYGNVSLSDEKVDK
jgi:hypothetical protein